MTSKWQHQVPLRYGQEDHAGGVAPIPSWNADRTHFEYEDPTKCRSCGRAIIRVGPNEGPEGLKALLR